MRLNKYISTGQGRFGKVYTVVNNQTGELLAMKEVQLKPGDHGAIRNAAEELQIFEGIQHPHLVRYYGLEIRRVRRVKYFIASNHRDVYLNLAFVERDVNLHGILCGGHSRESGGR